MFSFKFEKNSLTTRSNCPKCSLSKQPKEQIVTATIIFMLSINPIIDTTATRHIAATGSSRSSLQLKSHNLLQSTGPSLAPSETPDFEGSIGNHSVAVGKDVQLSCKINNLGNYRTAWLRVEDKGILTIHNNIITRNYRVGLLNDDDGKNFVLTIKNVQPSDKGGYMCQINLVPMKYSIGYLDVLTPPVFEESPPPSHNHLAPAASSSSSLVVDGSQADQATTPLNPQQQQQTSQVTVSEGSNASLSCRAHGHPAPEITWRREDGQPILLNGVNDDDEQLTKFEGSTLQFRAVHRLNSGAYLCIASNGVQPSASKRLVLDVQYSPVITLPQTDVSAHLGQAEASLECLANLNPAGTYHWVKLGQAGSNNQPQRTRPGAQEDDLWLIEHDELMQSDKYEIVIKQMASEKVQMILTIRQVEKKDFAWYKCLAKNSLGIQSNSVRFYESSSFSLNSMFRGGGFGGRARTMANDNNATVLETTEHDNNNLHLNDDSFKRTDAQLVNQRPQVPANPSQQPPRPLTRSSWIQRSSGSSLRNSASYSVTHPLLTCNWKSPTDLSLLFSLLFSCLSMIIASTERTTATH